MDDIRNFAITLPQPNEQGNIVEHLSIALGRYDSLVSAAEEAVALIRERRMALISAAVTGKIDVRNWKPPTDNNPHKSNKEAA